MRGSRWFVLAFVCCLAWTAPVQAASPVETFVQQNIDRGIAVMKDKSLDDAARRQQLAGFLAEVLDPQDGDVHAGGREAERRCLRPRCLCPSVQGLLHREL